jgi:serine protease Do
LPFSFATQSEAQDQSFSSLPLFDGSEESPFVKIATAVSPSVVNISAERVVTQDYNNFGWRFEGPFEDLFRDFFRDFPRQEGRAQTLGSGFIISDDGYIVTNYHVIKDASEIIVRLTDKREFKGDEVKIIGTDSRTDLALIKITTNENLPYLEFGDSDATKVGEWAIAVGNPFQLESTLTVGVISAKGRANIPLPEGPDLQSFLQTDAAINPGNSGGPLVNIRGQVIGVNTAITSPSGGNVGIGFAIPANLAKDVIIALRSEGKVVRGYLGVYLQEITEELQDALGLPSLNGVLISDVMEGTPADKAGIKSGDVVLAYGGQPVIDMQSFRLQVSATQAGKTVSMKVFRDGREKTLSVKIGQYPEDITSTPGEEESTSLGLSVVDINDPQAQRYDIQAEQGVLILRVMTTSAGAKAGLQAGDVILSIGKTPIDDTKDYQRTVKNLAEGSPVIFKIQRGERKLYVAVTP